MAATAPLIIMMQESEKAELEAEAREANVSTAEFVRRRLFGHGEPDEETLLEILAELEPMVREACETIDANLADIRELRERGPQRDAQAARLARRELTRAELTSIAQRLGSPPEEPASSRRSTARP